MAAHARRQNRWFHTVVVMGTSLGCGGQSVRYIEEGDAGNGGSRSSGGASGVGTGGLGGGAAGSPVTSGAGGTAGGAGSGVRLPDPNDCSHHAEFVCSDYAALAGCFCNPLAPRAPADCPNPLAFRCEAFPPGQITANTRYVGCSCASDHPTPETCPTPQIMCDRTSLGLANCRCDRSLPTSREECTGGEYFRCQSYDPDYGCVCECCTIR